MISVLNRALDWFVGAFSKTITTYSTPSLFFGTIGLLIGYFMEWSIPVLLMSGLLLPVWPVYAFHTNRRVVRGLLADLKEYHDAGLISEEVRDRSVELVMHSLIMTSTIHAPPEKPRRRSPRKTGESPTVEPPPE